MCMATVQNCEAELPDVLSAIQSKDVEALAVAYEKVNQWTQDQFPSYVGALTKTLCNASNPLSGRVSAGILLRDTICNVEAWLSVEPTTRVTVKSRVLELFNDCKIRIRNAAALILLAELPVSESQELFRNLLVKIIDPAVAWEFRQTSLDVVGFLGEEMESFVLSSSHSIQILSALSYSLVRPELLTNVTRSNIRAIYKCFYLWKATPMNELDAKALLTSVLQIAGSSADQEARVTSMAILVELVEMYYYYLPEFLDSICKITFQALQSAELEPKRQAIELWSVICDTEIILLSEMRDVVTKTKQPLYFQMQQRFIQQQRIKRLEEAQCEKDVEQSDQEPKKRKKHRAKRPREQAVLPFQASHFIVKKAAPQLVPLLLNALQRTIEDQGIFINSQTTKVQTPTTTQILAPNGTPNTLASKISDTHWFLWMASYVALELVAMLVKDEILELSMPFVLERLQSTDLELQNAAILAFAASLEGPSSCALAPYTSKIIPMLLSLLPDSSCSMAVGQFLVEDNLLYSFSKLFEVAPHAGAPNATQITNSVLSLLSLEPRFSTITDGCNVLINISTALQHKEDNPFDAAFNQAVYLLLSLSDTPTKYAQQPLATVYTALNVVISTSRFASDDALKQITEVILARLEWFLKTPVEDPPPEPKKTGLIPVPILLCGVLHCVLQKIQALANFYPDRMVVVLIRLLKSNVSRDVQEEAFQVIGRLATMDEGHVGVYMNHLLPYLIQNLRDKENPILPTVISTVGDIARLMGKAGLNNHADEILSLLHLLLTSPNVRRHVKPHILFCLGDLGWALGSSCAQYYVKIMRNFRIVAKNIMEEMKECGDELELLKRREEAWSGRKKANARWRWLILEGALVGMQCTTQAITTTPDLLTQQIEWISKFLMFLGRHKSVAKNQRLVNAIAGLVSDLAVALGPRIHLSLSQPFIQEIISMASAHEMYGKVAFPQASLKSRQPFNNVLLNSAINTTPSAGNVNVVSGYYSSSKDQNKEVK